MRVVLHVDLDYFYAQIEENLNPSLKDKPVVICVYSGRTEDSGVVSASNYIARSFGVKSGTPIYQAKRILKEREAVFLPVNHTLYEEVSDRIMSLLKAVTERFEQVSIDEAFLDVTDKVNDRFDKAVAVARSIKDSILDEEDLTCSIGIATNKLIAKIASAHKKPDGLTLVKPSNVTQFLSDLPVEKLPGIGKKTKRVLEKEGVLTCRDLASFDINKLKQLFGKKVGEHLHNASMGVDEEPVKGEPPKQFSRIVTLKEDSVDYNYISSILDQLCRDVWLTSKKEGFIFRSIGIITVMNDLKTRLRSKTLYRPSNGSEKIFEVTKELLKELLNETSEGKIRRIGIKVFNLVPIQAQKSIDNYM